MAKNAFENIKKQIGQQTREKIGNVKIDSKSSTYVDKPYGAENTLNVPIVWDNTEFYKNRGSDNFVLTPRTFNGAAFGIARGFLSSDLGDLKLKRHAYNNCRLAGVARMNRGGSFSFSLSFRNSSVSVYVDSTQVFNASINETNTVSIHNFEHTNIRVDVRRETTIRIYWYSYTDDATLVIGDKIGRQVDSWSGADNTPFNMPVIWDATTPISTGVDRNGIVAKSYVQLAFELDDTDTNYGDHGIGGFGIYNVTFSDIGAVTSVSLPDYITIDGDVGDHLDGWVKINNTTYAAYAIVSSDASATTTTIYALNADFSSINVGDTVYRGKITHKHDYDIGGDVGDLTFTYKDYDIVENTTYYYLIDTYDDSINKNRGNLTTSIQTIEASDTSAPAQPTLLGSSRYAYKQWRFELSAAVPADSDLYLLNVYEDYSQSYEGLVQSGSTATSLILDTVSGLEAGMPVSIEDVSGSTRQTHRIATVTTGTNTITFTTALGFTPATNDVVRILNKSLAFDLGSSGTVYGSTVVKRIVVEDLAVPCDYWFYFSTTDIWGNENMDDTLSDNITISNPTAPTLADSNIWSQKTDFTGEEREDEFTRYFE